MERVECWFKLEGYVRKLVKRITGLTKRNPLADDITQDVLAKLVETLANDNETPVPVLAYRIAFNCCTIRNEAGERIVRPIDQLGSMCSDRPHHETWEYWSGTQSDIDHYRLAGRSDFSVNAAHGRLTVADLQ